MPPDPRRVSTRWAGFSVVSVHEVREITGLTLEQVLTVPRAEQMTEWWQRRRVARPNPRARPPNRADGAFESWVRARTSDSTFSRHGARRIRTADLLGAMPVPAVATGRC